MTGCYKIIPGLLLAFYALCAVCPDRLVLALAAQATVASEPHDCHKPDKPKADSNCRTVFSAFLPTAEVKFAHALSALFVLPPQNIVSVSFDAALRVRTTANSNAGPPAPSLKLKLRI